MSQRWDQVEERLDDYESQLDAVYRLYHIPVLAALMAFMLWVRARQYERFLTDDGVLFAGNDAWYHYRATNYVIQNFPYNLGFDPWTGFDVGARAGQFGTMFDQIIALTALIVGLGDPSQSTIDMTFILAPAVFGTLCAVPVFFLGKRLGGRFGGIVAVLVLATTTGGFLTRSLAGFTDHHVAEALFQASSLLAAMVMVTVAQRDKPIYELIEARDFDALRRPALWGVLTGIATTLHIWVWQPAVFFVGIFAIFLFVVLSLEYVRGYSPDHIVIPSVIAMAVVALLNGLRVVTFELTPTDYSIAHPLLAILVALGAVFMAAVARLWDRTDFRRLGYPVAVLGSGGVAALALALVSPETFDFFIRQVIRVAGLTATDTVRTVGEVSSPWGLPRTDGPIEFFTDSYMLTFYTAIGGFGVLLYRIFTAERPRAEYVLVAVWSVFMLLMTLTQVRFDYYFIIAVAAANALLVREIYRFVDLEDVRRDVTKVKPYQVLIVVAILFVVVGPMVVTGATLDASRTGPGESQLWSDSLDWMEDNTPEPGAYGTGDDPRLEYYGAYGDTDDFEYQDGEYGVMAWWDYGHFITTGAERIPVANPFQQNAPEAADFLLADEEDEAITVLDEEAGEGAGVQYVMVDYQLGYAGTQKYNAPTTWETRHDVSRGDVGVTLYQNGERRAGVHTQRGYESMRVRLYQHHGSAKEPARFVTRFGGYNETAGFAVPPQEGSLIQQYNTSEEARQTAESDPNAVHGGLFGQPSERIEALEHFRLVHASDRTTADVRVGLPGDRSESWVKTFERVDGATIEGTGPANTEVEASVQMQMDTGKTFVYRQFVQTDENGNFEMTVPYSTTEYDQYGPEDGHTNVSVRANTNYRFVTQTNDTTWLGTAGVTEGQVLGEDDTAVEVEMEQVNQPGGQNATNDQQRVPAQTP